MKKIIYQNDTGISVIIPADCGLTTEEIAIKDVPNGTPFLIINTTDIPTDRTQRHLWQADFSNPHGYGGQA